MEEERSKMGIQEHKAELETELLDNFYEEMSLAVIKEDNLSEESKAIVLFRLAIQTAAAEVGINKVIYMMSKLMTATIGIMEGDDNSSYNGLLDDWDKSDVTEH